MQIALFCPFVHWPAHFATDLELAFDHRAAGDAVTMLACDGELPVCDVNLAHNPGWCDICVKRRGRGERLLPEGVVVEPLLRHLPAGAQVPAFPHFANRHELAAYQVDGFDIGAAAFSSLVMLLRDPDPDLDRHAESLRGLLTTAYLVHTAMGAYLDTHHVDRVYVFNPRFSSTRGVLRASTRRGVPCIAHEVGADLTRYALYPNVFPHDRAHANRDIDNLWNAEDDAVRRELGARYYRDKIVGIETYGNSFVAGHQPGLLPPGWDPAKRNIVAFTSSEDEYLALGPEWENPIYPNELTAVQEIVRSLADAPEDVHLFVRVHPNLTGIDCSQTRGLRALDHPRVTVIPAESPVSTYAMLREAWKIVTFGSTVGIEAVFWGIPSVLAGIAWYGDLGGTYNPATHEEVMALLGADLAPKDPLPALKYGLFSARFGTPYRHYRATSRDGGEFRGVDVWYRDDLENNA